MCGYLGERLEQKGKDHDSPPTEKLAYVAERLALKTPVLFLSFIE
jgi:hypothetical protein